MGYKSLIVSMEITTAGRGHDCRYNKKHRLEKGFKRLTVRSDGNDHHYCLGCAKIFLMNGVERLKELLLEVENIKGNGMISG